MGGVGGLAAPGREVGRRGNTAVPTETLAYVVLALVKVADAVLPSVAGLSPVREVAALVDAKALRPGVVRR